MESEKLWKKFSKAYREYKANEYGYVICFTCGYSNHYKRMDTGHYIDRRHGAVKFNPLNIEIQCMICNRLNNGQIEKYRKNLIERYGADVEELLHNEAKFGAPMLQHEVETMITYYKQLKKLKDEARQNLRPSGSEAKEEV